MNSKFLKYIAYLQVIGIILVVVGHSFHEYPYSDPKQMLLYRMMHAFRMPLFIFVSGFLLLYSTESRPSEKRKALLPFIARKARLLLLPYILLCAVTFVPRAMMSGMADDSIELSWPSFLTSMTHGWSLVIPFYWYLQAIFVLTALLYCLFTLSRKLRVNGLVFFTLLFISAVAIPYLPIYLSDFFSLGEAAKLAPFFILGCLCGRYSSYFNKITIFENPSFLVASICTFVTLFFFFESRELDELMILCSITGIVMCVSVARIIAARNITWLDHLVGTNYMIFLLSWFCNVFSQQVLHHFTDMPWWIYTILSLVSGVYVPWLIFRLLERHSDNKAVKVISYLLGQDLLRRKRMAENCRAQNNETADRTSQQTQA